MALLCILVIGGILYYKFTHRRRGIHISQSNIQPIAAMPMHLARAQQRRKELN